MKKAELDRLLEVAYAVDKDIHRSSLKGIGIKGDSVAGVSGYQVSIRKTSEDKFPEFILPMEVVTAYKTIKTNKNDKVSLFLEGNRAGIKVGDLIISSKPIDGEFINYKSLMPKEFLVMLKVDARTLVRKLDFFTDLVELTVFNESIVIESEQLKLGVNTFDTKGIGIEPFKICFNPKLLKAALKNYKDIVHLKFTTRFNPVIICNEEEDKIDLVLPMRKGPSCSE